MTTPGISPLSTPFTDADLTDAQRAWVPTGCWEAYMQWPAAWKIEIGDGALEFNDGGGGEGWDWRSVAMAARAFPGWRIVLRSPWLLAAHQPEPNVEAHERD